MFDAFVSRGLRHECVCCLLTMSSGKTACLMGEFALWIRLSALALEQEICSPASAMCCQSDTGIPTTTDGCINTHFYFCMLIPFNLPDRFTVSNFGMAYSIYHLKYLIICKRFFFFIAHP